MSETKELNVKEFNMITRINEVKRLVKHNSCNFKCKFVSVTCNSNKKWNNGNCQSKCKKYRICKKEYSWNPEYALVRIVSI